MVLFHVKDATNLEDQAPDTALIIHHDRLTIQYYILFTDFILFVFRQEIVFILFVFRQEIVFILFVFRQEIVFILFVFRQEIVFILFVFRQENCFYFICFQA